MIQNDSYSIELCGYLLLQNDNNFHKLSETEISNAVEMSTKMGKLEAKKTPKTRMKELFEHEGISIVRREGKHPLGIFSQIQIDQSTKKVELFWEYIMEKKAAMDWLGYDYSVDDIMEIHLAHEYYHYIEIINDQRTEERLPVLMKKRKLFSHRCYIVAASEIAAHIFAMEYCKLPFHPLVMDYAWKLYQGNHSEEDREIFLRRMK